ncbi:hypothetical protein [Actinoplanes palleronii]|uniref:Uncharacterized protein n=1 Tax=Actinoplanes palleronii TaxID=113570 RepID=A0ABQ4B6T7_9ACTN|nr:hypothetical protein [Actinoplanes palleronii]GIE66365.1 hypothetical protein Apa02nite_024730 [Actinoplanes palleronii]
MNSSTGKSRALIGTVVVAVLSAGAWFAWLGWDTEYQTDPATGVTSGPYEAWQVAGCALTLLVVFVGALLARVPALLASLALTLAFTAVWTAQAAAEDSTGMYGVGTIMLLLGLGTATLVVTALATAIRHPH